MSVIIVITLLLAISGCGGDSSGNKQQPPVATPPAEPPAEEPQITLSVSAVESGSTIYLDGLFTGKLTPADITVEAGEHTIGIGLAETKHYLKKSLWVEADTQSLQVNLDDADKQAAKVWRALFIGVNKVAVNGSSCISEYSTHELDLGFEFFNWSFHQRVEDYSYNTTEWQIDRRDIYDETVLLSADHLITPEIIAPYLQDVYPGDYDLIVTFFRGGAGTNQGCYIDDFRGIAWYDYRVLAADASYFTIRYYDDVEGAINASKQNDADPGMFIHEWLHTTAERFFPDRGYTMPKQDGQVVHAAEAYHYSAPWMTWYRDLIAGQVPQGDNYIGIGPEAFLACSVREAAISACPE
jgi:hypothetical protein